MSTGVLAFCVVFLLVVLVVYKCRDTKINNKLAQIKKKLRHSDEDLDQTKEIEEGLNRIEEAKRKRLAASKCSIVTEENVDNLSQEFAKLAIDRCRGGKANVHINVKDGFEMTGMYKESNELFGFDNSMHRRRNKSTTNFGPADSTVPDSTVVEVHRDDNVVLLA